MKAKNADYIKKTMTQNATAEGLTGTQHDALHILCTYRHQFHSNMGAVACGAEEGKRLENFFRFAMPIMLRSVNLPGLDVSGELDALATYGIRGEAQFSGVVRNALLEEINLKVEDYLRRIDYLNGTSYAPSGFARITHSCYGTEAYRKAV